MLSSETEQLSIRDATERSGYGDYSSRDAAFIARRILSQITMNRTNSNESIFFSRQLASSLSFLFFDVNESFVRTLMILGYLSRAVRMESMRDVHLVLNSFFSVREPGSQWTFSSLHLFKDDPKKLNTSRRTAKDFSFSETESTESFITKFKFIGEKS